MDNKNKNISTLGLVSFVRNFLNIFKKDIKHI